MNIIVYVIIGGFFHWGMTNSFFVHDGEDQSGWTPIIIYLEGYS